MTYRYADCIVSRPFLVESNRLTEEAKAELAELGEETDGVVTTMSKLRSTILAATKVGSNGFKGFDILDENGNYKSTYEIMLGIAEIYQEIVESDKKLGDNKANLLLETVAKSAYMYRNMHDDTDLKPVKPKALSLQCG